MGGEYGSDEEGGPFAGGSSHNQTDASAPAKSLRFGLLELGIFMALWVVVIVGLKVYTRRAKRSKEQKRWFGENEEKAAYEELLAKEPGNEEALKKALMRRAMTDVRHMLKLQEEHDSIMALSRAGAISEEMLLEFKRAEKEVELEMFEVQAEAETFKEGWSQEIVRDAARLCKIEDELMEVKRRKEKEERRKNGGGEEEGGAGAAGSRRPKEKTHAAAEDVPTAAAAVVGEEERKKILAELLGDEEAGTAEASKTKKRTGAGVKTK